MILGIDFDNTIVCYDRLFHRLAVEQGLVPADVPATKADVRDYLRSIDREDDWTQLQGLAYGDRILEADPFPGVVDALSACHGAGMQLRIVSHKTRHPYRGPRYDLHEAAHHWLAHHGLIDPDRTGLNCDNVYLELTKADKLHRIAELGCTHFIDDLPEFLAEPEFPDGVQPILFDPVGRYTDSFPLTAFRSWFELQQFLAVTAA